MRSIVFLFVLASLPLVARTDTTTVRLLDKHLVITDPTKGVRQTGRTVHLPAGDPQPRRILLSLTYACPDTMRCADWDYLDHVLVRPLHTTDTFEVARMLTPYGGYFKSDWQFTWMADVTDFATVLRDSVEVIHVHHGYEPNNDRGWAVTMDLHYIAGPPIAPVLGIQELYRGHFAYGDKALPIEAALSARTVPQRKDAAWLRIRSQQTGHGMNADGCGEFCAKWRRVLVDGQEVQRRTLWRECASNPLFPQAGTWIFDRADWCPGELQPPDHITVPLLGKTRPRTVDFDMEPYLLDSSTAFTNLAAYAVQLGKANAMHDAMITEVLVPSDTPRHARMNEAHSGPRMVIGNAGSEPLRSLKVQYTTVGDHAATYHWKGHLPFGATDTVDLPGPIVTTAGKNVFFAAITEPNGKADAWPHDNTTYTPFTAPEMLPTQLILHLRTNAQPEQNALQLQSDHGPVIIDRPLGTLKADTLYVDTLHLPAGTHRLQLTDTAGDGLSFWFNTDGGHGHLRLLDGEGRLLKRFESDCGNGIIYTFRTGGPSQAQPDTVPAISLFPRRTKGRTRLDYFANAQAMLLVQVTNEEGTVMDEVRAPHPVRTFNYPIDITGAAPGRYYVTVQQDGREVFRERIRIEE